MSEDTWSPAVRRTGRVERVTKETSVLVELDLDGSGTADVTTGVPFFDHMLAQLAKHGLLDLTVRSTGDIEVDAHHTVEDTALALGQALRDALGDKSGICRFGDAAVPLDETLARAAIDLSGRPYLVHAEPDGSFSIVVMVWLPGQQTPIHDHLTWCCTAVLQGTEYEEVYAHRGDHLEAVARNANPVGMVSGFAPPGDVHRVTNIGDSVAVSMHVYGTDITRVGSSVRRVYDLPVR